MQGQLGANAYPGQATPPLAGALPRDPREFITGAFGPLTPIVPIGIDVPPPGEERPEPRRWQYPVGWNLPVGVPRSEGLTLTNFANLRALADSYCLAPQTRVLCSDLVWRPVGELHQGDRIVAFDEFPEQGKHRKLRVATVTTAERIVQPCYRVTFADGRQVVASDKHLWLSGRIKGGRDGGYGHCDQCGQDYQGSRGLSVHVGKTHLGGPVGRRGAKSPSWQGGWVATRDLRPGSTIRNFGQPWQEERTWQSGYLAGAFDGEGWLSTPGLGNGSFIGFAQKPGAVLDQVEGFLKECHYKCRYDDGPGTARKLLVSGLYDTLRLIGTTRPARFLGKVEQWLDGAPAFGRARGDQSVTVTQVEYLGPREVVAIGTTTKTLIAEGFFSHNSVARACINLRVNEILGLEWDIGPTHAAEKLMRGDRESYRDFNERKAQLVSFFRRPDPNYYEYQSFMRALLEDIFVIDAATLYIHPSRRKGKGLMGSDIAGLDLIDGTTIRPLVDLSGATPTPPNVAYQQYLWGVPRSDLMSLILESDMPDISEGKLVPYRADQLLYLRYFPRDWTVYGFPLVEQSLIPLLAGLAKQQYTMQWFCYDAETEILTDEGWKKFPKVRGDERFATRSPQGQFEWQASQALYRYDYDGDLVHFQNRRVDLLVTPNHRMLTRYHNTDTRYRQDTPRAEWHFEQADTFLGQSTRQVANWQLPLYAEWAGVSPASIRLGNHDMPTQAFTRFLGLFLAEGWVRNDRAEVYVAQARTSKWFADIELALKETGLRWSYMEANQRFVCYSADLKRWLQTHVPGRAWEKRVPRWVLELAAEDLGALWEGFWWGDGTTTNDGQRQLVTTSRGLADDLQELGLKAGIVSRVLSRKPPGPRSRRPQYIVVTNDGGRSTTSQGRTACVPPPKTEHYQGKVYCPSTPNGVVLVRRNGKAVWCGNSEGSIPGLFLDPGPEVTTPQQMALLQHAINSMAGDVGFKHKIIVLPYGAKPMPMKPVALADQFDQLVQTWTLMVFEIQPMELGMLPGRHAGSGTGGSATATGTGTGAAAIQAAIQNRKSLRPLLMFLKRAIFDLIIQDKCGQWDMEWKWVGMDQNPVDPDKRAQELKTLWSFGALSLDEVRDESGKPPWGLAMSSDPVYATATGIQPLGQVPFAMEQQAEGMKPPIVPPPPAGTPLAVGPAAESAATGQGGTGEQAGQPPAQGGTPMVAGGTATSPQVVPLPPQSPEHETTVVPRGHMRPKRAIAEVTWSPEQHSRALNELDIARRLVKKGKALATFVPEHLPPDIWDRVMEAAQSTDDDKADLLALDWGLDLVMARSHIARREAKVAAHQKAMALPMSKLVKQVGRHRMGDDEFIVKVTDGLHQELAAIAQEGVTDARVALGKGAGDPELAKVLGEEVVTPALMDKALLWAGSAEVLTKNLAAHEERVSQALRAAYEAGFYRGYRGSQ